MRLTLPPVLAMRDVSQRAQLRQLAAPARTLEGSIAGYTRGRLEAHLFRSSDNGQEILIVSKGTKAPKGALCVVATETPRKPTEWDLSGGIWLKHPSQITPAEFRHASELSAVLDSWTNAFSFIAEDVDRGIIGLRGPQLGALHAAHAHWSVSDSTATIVMPTGTGKTDTMIAILVSKRCPRLLVVVPTDALRMQLAEKFLTLGVFSAPGSNVLSATARFPIVTTLHQVPRTLSEFERVVQKTHVLITTSSIAALCGSELQERLAEHCPYFFIDEAHHAEAPTWRAFKDKFKARRVLQFTATPFREDGKPLDGKIIYKYPLKKAQQEGYFKPIKFSPVTQYNPQKSDVAIAERAIAQLREDYDKGHILMARVGSVERARKVYEIYRSYAQYEPVQLHSGLGATERDAARSQILSGKSRVIVCVDMLGEGFDLPELKIAAFHDIRKSLAITLQLAGRFTRSRPDLGDATFVANVADIDVQEELRKLYTRDPDWNALLPEFSETAIAEQVELQQFLAGFGNFPDDIPLKDVRPATSAVVYRTSSETWHPEQFRDGIPAISSCEQVHHAVNEAEHTLIVVTARRARLRWTDSEILHDWVWELFLAIWSPQQRLLFINGSSNSGEYLSLARALCGNDVSLVRGPEVFRIFAGINRLHLQNVGLTEQLGRNIRYTGRMGSDVEPAMSEVQRRRGTKAVLAGSGFEHGRRTAVGASRRGRVWSFRREPVHRLAAWCKAIGAKLTDSTIDPDEVLRGTLRTDTVTTRPAAVPIAVDWPEEMYDAVESAWALRIGSKEFNLGELSIEPGSMTDTGPITLRIIADGTHVDVTLELFEEDGVPNCRFLVDGEQAVEVIRGEGEAQQLSSFFYRYPPVIGFADGSCLEGNEYVALRGNVPPYDRQKIATWNWVGTDICRESQGPERDAGTIQARVIRDLRTQNYSIIVDDDSAGEIADVVAIRLVDEVDDPRVEVDFFHCKFSGGTAPGHRIKDLYEVCGQAQKSISWMTSPERQTDIFTHLLRRDAARLDAGRPTRFEIGTPEELQTVLEFSRTHAVRVRIFIVQPGLSRADASRDQLELLSVTENHLMETYQLPFGVIASP